MFVVAIVQPVVCSWETKLKKKKNWRRKQNRIVHAFISEWTSWSYWYLFEICESLKSLERRENEKKKNPQKRITNRKERKFNYFNFNWIWEFCFCIFCHSLKWKFVVDYPVRCSIVIIEWTHFVPDKCVYLLENLMLARDIE